MRLSVGKHSKRRFTAEAASLKPFVARVASIVLAVVLVASSTPAAAFAGDPPSDNIVEYVSCDVKPGQYFYLKADYFTHEKYGRYSFNLDSKKIEGEGVINEVNPSDTRYKFLAKCCGTAQVELVFSASDGPQHLRITYEIKVSPYEITLTPNSKSGIYDGTEKSVSGFETLNSTIRSEGVTSLNGPFQSETYSKTVGVEGLSAEARGTDAGEYPVEVSGWALIGDDNGTNLTNWCQLSYADAKLVIGQRPVTLTSASDSREYDGKPLTNNEVTVGGDGWVDGQGATYTFTGSRKTVGSSDNAFNVVPNEGTDLNNYKITKQYGTLAVTDRAEKYQITLTPNSGSETCDGTEKSVSGFETLEFEVDGSTYTVEGLTAEARGTDAGEYPVEVSGQAVVIDSDGNNVTDQFIVNIDDAKLTIVEGEPAPIDPDESSSDTPSKTTGKTAASKLAKTGDGIAPYAMGICAVAITAGAVALFTLRKRNSYK